MRQLSLIAATVVLLAVACTATPGRAQAVPQTPPAADPAGPAPVATVEGYRSAHFGMTEADVRQAIATDFGKETAIKAQDQLGEQTRVLTIKVGDLIQGGGKADVSYVLGYKTRKLIQVSVVWSTSSDPSLTTERLMANAELLVAYFQARGYKPDTVVTNIPIPDGVILFRGEDQEGRQTAVLLRGTSTETKGQRAFVAHTLGVYYIGDPKHPDVFRIPSGQF